MRVRTLAVAFPRAHFTAVAAALLALLTLASACGGAEATEVHVTLDEWSITPSVSQASAGDVRFVAKNDGSVQHELMIVKTDLAPNALPLTSSPQVQGKVDENAVDIVGEIEAFLPGETETETFDLEAGKYVLICNLVDGQEAHYGKGMYIGFTVTQ
jgi:uncharacterized cupredoxin-like copper-binding protein